MSSTLDMWKYLMKKHGIKHSQAKEIVREGRSLLGLSRFGKPTEELDRLCIQLAEDQYGSLANKDEMRKKDKGFQLSPWSKTEKNRNSLTSEETPETLEETIRQELHEVKEVQQAEVKAKKVGVPVPEFVEHSSEELDELSSIDQEDPTEEVTESEGSESQVQKQGVPEFVVVKLHYPEHPDDTTYAKRRRRKKKDKEKKRRPDVVDFNETRLEI